MTVLGHLAEFLVRTLRHAVFVVGLALDGLGVLVLWRADASQLTLALPYLLLALATAFVVSAFLVFQEERRKNEPRPKVSDLLDVQGEARWSRSRPGSPDVGRYLGFRFDSRTDGDVANCRVRLEALEHWLPNSGSWFAPEWFSRLLLAWSFNDGGGDSKTIAAGSNRTCDLVAYEGAGDTHAKIIAAQDALRESNAVGFGRWRVRCRVEADDCRPFDLEATFDWQPRNTDMGQMRTLDFIEPPRVL